MSHFIASAYFIIIFSLDEKETKNQEKMMLSPHKANPRPPFFRAPAPDHCRCTKVAQKVGFLFGQTNEVLLINFCDGDDYVFNV